MSAQAGRDMLLKIKDGQGAFITLAGLRTKSLKLNARAVDITHSGSLNAWRELLPGAGVKTADISGAGIFSDAASDALARTAFFDQSAEDYQIIIPDSGIIEGPFLLTGLSYVGSYQSEARYEITLASTGAPTFAVI